MEREMENLLKAVGAASDFTGHGDETLNFEDGYRSTHEGIGIAPQNTSTVPRTTDESFGDREALSIAGHPDLSIFGAEGQLLYQDIVDGDLTEHDDLLQNIFLNMKSAARLHIIQIKQRLINENQVDTIYHEHLFYHSIKSLIVLFGRHGLIVTDVERLPDVLGGSLRISVEKYGYTTLEEDAYLCFSEMQKRTDYYAYALRETLVRLKAEGKSVWGFGAAAKTTVMLNYAHVPDGLIGAVADDTLAKQGKYIPGTGVQVRSTQEWLKAQPDYTCIFTWNYANVIANKFAQSYKGTFFSSMWTDYAHAPEGRINGRRVR